MLLLALGASFVNVQIHVAPGGGTSLAAVSAALNEVLAEQDYVPVDGAEAAERTVVVRPGGSWIAVYDSEEGFGANELACALSERLTTQACVVAVHDSDVLELGLYYGGVPLDRFNSRPDYDTQVSAAERKALAGRPDAWSGVRKLGATPAELKQLWRKKKRFAEDALRGTAELLGLENDNVCLGYRYLETREPDDVVLGFRQRVPRAATPARAGAPRFEFASGLSRVVTALGKRVVASCSVRNHGGPGRGLTLHVRGDALAHGLVTLDDVELLVRRGEAIKSERAPWKADPTGESHAYVASFPELAITAAPKLELPPGVTLEAAQKGDDPSIMMRLLKLAATAEASSLHLSADVHLRVQAIGTGALNLGFRSGEPAEGRYDYAFDVRVFAPAQRPLRAPADAPIVPRLPEDILFALCSFDLDPVRAAAVAANLIERFSACFEASDELKLAVFPRESRGVRTSKAERRGFFGGRRWKKLVSELPRARIVKLECEAVRAKFFDPRRSDGAAFRSSLSAQDVPDDEELPTLALWCSLEGAGGERARAVRALADELMAEAVLSHSAVQASVGYSPTTLRTFLDTTDYEQRAGIHNGPTLRRSWLERFVRSVGVGTLWLGKPLLARLADRSALERVARVEAYPHAVKITLDQDDAVPEVEAALSTLLPSPRDQLEAEEAARRRKL
jgi:hypothetical protein